MTTIVQLLQHCREQDKRCASLHDRTYALKDEDDAAELLRDMLNRGVWHSYYHQFEVGRARAALAAGRALAFLSGSTVYGVRLTGNKSREMTIQRYTNRSTPDGVWLDKADDGDWVLYADHEAELEALRADIKIAVFRLIEGDNPRDVAKGLCTSLQGDSRTADAAMRAEG